MTEVDVAKRIVADPRRAAMRLSVDDILALATRCGALDELATDVHELFKQSDNLAALKAAKAPLADRKSAADGITSLIDTIADRLIELDYAKPKEPENDETSQGAERAAASAAE